MGVARLCYRACGGACFRPKILHVGKHPCFSERLAGTGIRVGGTPRAPGRIRGRCALAIASSALAVTASLRLRIGCGTTEASLCSRASTVQSVLRYSPRESWFWLCKLI